MAVHAAVELLADRSPDPWFAKIKAVNPGYGDGYALVARQLEMHYRYEDATGYYRKAVEADPRLWSAHSALGIDLMRMGQEDEPREQLELAYNNGYRDAATVNSLRLLDSYKNFVTFKDSTTILKLRKEEADLLRPYFDEELHKTIANYQKKYKMTLPAPVQLEVYPDHEDFAVRTMGMPGLGALGVTFGEVVAMDSPSGRKPGDFNWGATLWHEMSHVYILTMTKQRVPRWFTEGLAVHEEGNAAPEWANRVTPDVLAAIRDKKLLPIAKLDRGFVSPEYPAQVIVSYYQAGTICDFIGSKWGEDKLLAMAHDFGDVKPTAEVLQKEFSLSPEEFDKQYMAWLEERDGKMAANFDTWRTKIKALVELERATPKDNDKILTQAAEVRALYPQYVEDANAYEYMAEAHLAKDDKKAAMADLSAYEKAGGQSPATLKKLAALEDEAGDGKAASATLNRILFIYPVHDEDLHRKLGALWLAQGNYPGAIREASAVVAMKPLDKAGAQYNLAQAYFAAGQKDKAEETVLGALESAPGYKPAQKLLLEIEKPGSAASSSGSTEKK
jgi:tetratricopeptide (TPR) repeat protein